LRIADLPIHYGHLPAVLRLRNTHPAIRNRYGLVKSGYGSASAPHIKSRLNTHLVFVYGTLRRGSERAMSIRFPPAKFIAEGNVRGTLFDLGAYPGLLANENGSLVKGEVYQVDDETLRILDKFEASSNYRRKQIEVLLGTGKTVCWVYEPDAESCFQRNVIASGDWIEYARARMNRSNAPLPGDIQS
jgi:gamma-glutamylcyclotransferase (GGCT)/AIG2-like uncharacterized protein YtfP